MSDPGDEPVEVVDADGIVVDVTSRRRMRAGVLRHRCTYVAVVVGAPEQTAGRMLGADTELIVHRRADWKDTYPSHWDLAFGGVCGVDEEWREAAARELAEEAGITASPLRDLGSCSYESESNRVVGRVYLASWPDEPVCSDGEVTAVDRVRLADLRAWVSQRPVCPDSVHVVMPRLLDLLTEAD